MGAKVLTDLQGTSETLGARTPLHILQVSGDGSLTPANATALQCETVSIPNTETVLGTSLAILGIVVQADPANTANVLVGSQLLNGIDGPSGGQHIVLTPGDSVSFPISNRNLVYAKAVSGTQSVNYLATAVASS